MSIDEDNVDITVSPSHGIFITNIARLHQLPLPGSASSPSAAVPGYNVRAQITAASAYYTRLTMIISCNIPSADRMNQLDTKALAILRTFATHLHNDIGKTEVEIVIAYAGIEGIAHCIINVIVEA